MGLVTPYKSIDKIVCKDGTEIKVIANVYSTYQHGYQFIIELVVDGSEYKKLISDTIPEFSLPPADPSLNRK